MGSTGDADVTLRHIVLLHPEARDRRRATRSCPPAGPRSPASGCATPPAGSAPPPPPTRRLPTPPSTADHGAARVGAPRRRCSWRAPRRVPPTRLAVGERTSSRPCARVTHAWARTVVPAQVRLTRAQCGPAGGVVGRPPSFVTVPCAGTTVRAKCCVLAVSGRRSPLRDDRPLLKYDRPCSATGPHG